MEFRSLNEFTLDRLAALWNDGFAGYFVDATTTPEGFLRRFAVEQLSLDLSFAAVLNGEPIGFVLSGARTIQGRKLAWNGGTGIVPARRGQGVGKAMIAEALRRYEAASVGLATLEAISANEAAIALYERMGYRTMDRLKIFQHGGELTADAFGAPGAAPIAVRRGPAHELARLACYDWMAPWQTQWMHPANAEAAIAYDEQGRPLGYALFKTARDEEGKPASIALFQCRAAASREDAGAVVGALLSDVFPPGQTIARRTLNLPASHDDAVRALEQAGFTLALEQVYMTRSLPESR